MENVNRKVSVIIPSFNRKKYLWIVLPSYLLQRYVYEVLIIDDGSTEDYSDVVSYFSDIADKNNVRFRYFRFKERRGAPVARNLGIENSKEEYILFSDDDIILSRDFIDIAVSKLISLNTDILGGETYSS